MSHFSDVFTLPRGLRVLVTAGASGIGRAISDLLIDGGARVHICDVSDEFLAEYRSAHPGSGATKADVASEADVARLFDEVRQSLAASTPSSTMRGSPGRPAASRKFGRRTGEERSTSA